MDPHLISTTLSPEDQQAIGAAIDALRQKLPFLIDLTKADRVRMPKASDKTAAFVRKAMQVGNEHSGLFPASFLEEMRKDIQLLDSLEPIRLAIKTLVKKLDDTTMQLGGESYAAARTIYAVTKAPHAQAALRTAFGDLGKRFLRRRKNGETEEAPPQIPAETPVAAAETSAPPTPAPAS